MSAKKKEEKKALERNTNCINDPLDMKMKEAMEHVYGHTSDEGLTVLSTRFPQRYKEVYDELGNNWSEEGIRKWKESMERGLRKVGEWYDKKQLTLI